MSGDSYIALAILCFGAAIVLFLLELVIPSGGILGLLSAVSLVAGVVFLFLEDTTYGLYGAIFSLAALPIAFYGGLSLWERSPMAKWITLDTKQPALTLRDTSEDADPDAQPQANPNAHLVGKTGKVLSDLRPVGMCLIDGERIECLAQRGVITRGSQVEVVTVEGMQVLVRPIESA